MKYRPLSYWAWMEEVNDKKQPAQAAALMDGGYGGFVAHARGGLVTPYLGEDWRAAAKASAAVAEERGGLAIFDDEYGWPSGFGGGRVTALGEDCQLKILRAKEVFRAEEIPPRTLCFCDGEGRTLCRPAAENPCPPAYPCTAIYAETVREYSDNMNARATEEFIRAGYEPYERTGAGFFTDEPQLARTGVPWSDELVPAFRRKYGREIAPLLPALFFDCDGAFAARHDYFALVTALFRENYARKIHEWCEERGKILSGHFCWEENLYLQIQTTGAAMSMYEHMTVPGVDALLRESPDDMCVLQMTSVAEQTGKSRCLSESFGAAGWNISIADRRYIAEKQMVLGVNMMVDHLALGSLRGARKREFPASLSPVQPWWEYNELYAAPIGRLSEKLAEGEYSPAVLLLHPMRTAFGEYRYRAEHSHAPTLVLPAEKSLRAATAALLKSGFSFHYGDEDVLAAHGGVSGGKLTAGKGTYSVAVLPGMRTVSSAVFALLRAFAAADGRILCADRRPELLDGRDSRAVRAFFEGVPLFRAEELPAEIGRTVARPLTVQRREGGAVYVRSFLSAGRRAHYLVNAERDREAVFSVRGGGGFTRWNPDTDEESPFDPDLVRLPGGGSLFLYEGESAAVPAAEKWRETRRIRRAPIAEREENILLLDYARLSEDGGEFSPPEYLMEIQSKLLRRARNGRVTLLFSFRSEGYRGELSLAVEQPEKCKITFNGTCVSGDAGFWRDEAVRKVPLGRPREGENTIAIEREFYCSEKTYAVKNNPALHEAEGNRVTVETELENVLLLGDFEVRSRTAGKGERSSVFFFPDFALVPPTAEHGTENLTAEGFPFYAGNVLYRAEFSAKKGERLRVRLERPQAIALALRFNGKDLGALAREPYVWTLPEAEEQNALEVRVSGSLRNALGPSHLLVGESGVVSPGHYGKLGPDMFTENYASVAFGAGEIVLERAEE